MSDKHHVAWADRLGFNKRWAKNLETCDIAFGTDGYRVAVWRLYYSIVNIYKGPALKDKVDKYLNDVWYPDINANLEEWKKKYVFQAADVDQIRAELEDLKEEKLPELCNFISQLLEDNGFGFYASAIEEDDVSLNK